MMEIIAGLNRRYGGTVEIEGVFWEQAVYPAHDTFQAQIEEPAKCDLVVCILWSRIGSPLPSGWPKRPDPEGTPYESGTVYEFETALAARRGGAVPDIYVFRKLLPDDRSALDELMEAHPAEKPRILDFLIGRARDDNRVAIELLEGFWSRWFYSPDKGFIAAFNNFSTADHFTELGRRAIEEWLIAKGLATRQPDWDIDQMGSPYPGLEPFDEHHAAVFYGRTRVTERALALLRGGAEAEFPWLLVTGPSGSGKSSLLRAGIVPALTEETVLETWRVALVRPGAEDPLTNLLEGIAAAGVLGPALAAGDYPIAADLVRITRLSPPELVRTLLRALDRHAETVRVARKRNLPPLSRLLLVIDQMEELLLAPPDQQSEFGASVMALLAHGRGRIWVAATLRSDLQEPFLNIAAFQPLLTLEQGGRELKLAPPGPADMREVIEGPAARAGLSFEQRASDGHSLSEELVAAVGAAADSLPLLQMTLALLFDRRDPERRELRWADYQAMGGLEGAIADQAEAVLRGVPPEVRDELGPLLRQLTRLWLSLDGEIEARPTEIDETRLSGARAALAAALVKGRILVADHGDIRIAHEAVLRNWDRAQEFLSADLDLARLKARLEPLLAEWIKAGSDPTDEERLLPAGAQLAAADAAAQRYASDEIGEALAEFIAASVEADRRRRTRRLRILAITAGAFAILSLAAIAGGLFAWHERGIATEARGRAESNYQLALDQAAGSVRLLEDSYEIGGISSTLLQQLVDKAAATLGNLAGDTDDVVAARVKLLDVLALGNTTLGDYPAARKFVDQQERLVDGLRARQPDNAEWLKLWAAARVRAASVMFWEGDIPGAIRRTEKAIEIAARLAEAAPNDEALHQDLIGIYVGLGDSLRQQGDIDGAERAYRAWLAEARALAERQPKKLKWQRLMAFAHQRLGDNLLVWNKPEEAAAEYRIYAALADALVAEEPGNGLFLEARTVSQQRLGDTWLMQQRYDEAEREFRKHVESSERLLAIDPTNYRWRIIAATAHQRLGELRFYQGRFAEAEAEFRIYLAKTEDTLRKDRRNSSALYDAANARQEVGDALFEAGKLDEALEQYRRSMELARELTERLSTNPPWQKMRVIAHQRIGMVLKLQGDRDAALIEFRRCAADPIKSTVWSPRTWRPKDVTQECRQQIALLSRASPR